MSGILIPSETQIDVAISAVEADVRTARSVLGAASVYSLREREETYRRVTALCVLHGDPVATARMWALMVAMIRDAQPTYVERMAEES